MLANSLMTNCSILWYLQNSRCVEQVNDYGVFKIHCRLGFTEISLTNKSYLFAVNALTVINLCISLSRYYPSVHHCLDHGWKTMDGEPTMQLFCGSDII